MKPQKATERQKRKQYLSQSVDDLILRSERNESGCLIGTQMGHSKNGYGFVNLNGRHLLFHRAMWTLSKGPIPKGMCVCHKCDNPACGEPTHLFLGTQSDNMKDMAIKKRAAHGERHHNSRITSDTVKEIRRQASLGISQRSIGKNLGLGQSHVNSILKGRLWRHA
jgi:hypothetical protein